MPDLKWGLGVDIGGTKIEVAQVQEGQIVRHKKFPTPAQAESGELIARLLQVVGELCQEAGSMPGAMGVGIAGQITPAGVVTFSPNLPKWRQVPLKELLQQSLKFPISILNDVRAATWGEWKHGAGKGYQDLVCLFIGTGIGGGIISGGRMLIGASSCAGELGHITILKDGPLCHCGNRGCLEALSSGWALTQKVQQAVRATPKDGQTLLNYVNGDISLLTPHHVIQGVTQSDPLSLQLVDEVVQALVAGAVGIVNALNPARLILGGGLGEAIPNLPEKVRQGVYASALKTATASLDIVGAYLHNQAGVIGAADFSLELK